MVVVEVGRVANRIEPEAEHAAQGELRAFEEHRAAQRHQPVRDLLFLGYYPFDGVSLMYEEALRDEPSCSYLDDMHG